MSDTAYMAEAIDFARTNRIWPFAAVIVHDVTGDILVRAADAAHISPIYHAEPLALHVLATEMPEFQDNSETFTLYCTAEIEPMGMGCLFWANLLGFSVSRAVYGATLNAINRIWDWGDQMDSRTFNHTFQHGAMTIDGPIMEKECLALFEQAHQYQETLAMKRPGKTLSMNPADFWEIVTPQGTRD